MHPGCLITPPRLNLLEGHCSQTCRITTASPRSMRRRADPPVSALGSRAFTWGDPKVSTPPATAAGAEEGAEAVALREAAAALLLALV